MTQDLTVIDETTALKENQVEMEVCSNCGIQLEGKFCHSCGQSSKSMIKFFGEVIKELLDDALGYDSRFKHSLVPLIFKPGRLTLDYVKGKRFHYVLPFKLYLITSVLLILVIKNTATSDVITFEDTDDGKTHQQISEQFNRGINDALEDANDTLEEERQNIDVGIINIGGFGKHKKPDLKPADSLQSSGNDQTESTSTEASVEMKASKNNRIITLQEGDQTFNFEWDPETKQLEGIEKLDPGITRTFLEKINPKLKYWVEDPQPVIDSVIETLPYMMFVILPIFALFLKFFYLFSKRFYTEHLIFLLHNHSFIYLLLMIQIGLGFGAEKLIPVEHWMAQAMVGTFNFLSAILNVWMVVYVVLAIKRFYQQGWSKTIFKTLALGFIYLMLLSFGFILTMAFGAYQA